MSETRNSATDTSLFPIKIDTLTFHADGQVLLDVPDLEISADGPSILMGPNGAGKSLFLRILHGLIEPSSGSVSFNGRKPDQAIRRQQAMVFQKPVMLRRSVGANIDYALKVHGHPRPVRRQMVRGILNNSRLASRSAQAARTLSGGEQQQLAIIRAQCGNPAILLLDEPTASLDPAASLAIEEMVTKVAQGGTKVIMITHDLGLARRLSGSVIFFDAGSVCEQTPARQFFAQPASEAGRQFLMNNLALRSESGD